MLAMGWQERNLEFDECVCVLRRTHGAVQGICLFLFRTGDQVIPVDKWGIIHSTAFLDMLAAT